MNGWCVDSDKEAATPDGNAENDPGEPVEQPIDRPPKEAGKHRLLLGFSFSYCVFGSGYVDTCALGLTANLRVTYLHALHRFIHIGATLDIGYPHLAGGGPKLRLFVYPGIVYFDLEGHIGAITNHWLVYGLQGNLGFVIPLSRRVSLNIEAQVPLLFSRWGLHGFARVLIGVQIRI